MIFARWSGTKFRKSVALEQIPLWAVLFGSHAVFLLDGPTSRRGG